jgi:hypothetical protein
MSIGIGHLYFAAAFSVVFLLATAWLYWKDLKQIRQHYRQLTGLAIFLAAGILLLVVIKHFSLHS